VGTTYKHEAFRFHVPSGLISFTPKVLEESFALLWQEPTIDQVVDDAECWHTIPGVSRLIEPSEIATGI
jgi:hypothetical protein